MNAASLPDAAAPSLL
jgi:hypothetical protein